MHVRLRALVQGEALPKIDSYSVKLAISIDSTSMLCTGIEQLHIELGVRTLCELALNLDYYLQPTIVSLVGGDGSIYC